MTNENVYDVLEICFQSLDQGADVESCLARYPEWADDLRPALAAAAQVRSIPEVKVPADAARRGKARLLQAAAEMREQERPAMPFWRKNGFFGGRFFRLAATTTAMIAFLLTSGTGLVSASSAALPGDHLYPVNRSWEGIQLFFVLDSHRKVELEHQFDHERVQEIEGLYSAKRTATVNFQGVIQSQQNGVWVIDGLTVAVNHETQLNGEYLTGATVQVIGDTEEGNVKAKQLILVATPGFTPEASNATATSTVTPWLQETMPGSQYPEGSNTPGDDGYYYQAPANPAATATPGKGSEGDTQVNSATHTPAPGGDNWGGSENSESDRTGAHHHATPTPTSRHKESH
jgi:hypothetical protein